jgi:hypothetical protein
VLGDLIESKDQINNLDETFAYDWLYRLTSWKATGSYVANKTYQYDEISNMTYQTEAGKYNYDSSSQPHAVKEIIADDNSTFGIFKYDLAGNQTSSIISNKTRTVTYTTFNKPLLISDQDAQIQFYYDADRKPFARVDNVKQNDKTITTTMVNLGDYIIEDIAGGATPQTNVKIYIGPYTELVSTNQGRVIYELLRDNFGSITEITDGSGNILQRFHYEPFGKQKLMQGEAKSPTITRRGFVGQQMLEPFNMIFLDDRIYDPIIAKYLSVDSDVKNIYNMQNLNDYSY